VTTALRGVRRGLLVRSFESASELLHDGLDPSTPGCLLLDLDLLDGLDVLTRLRQRRMWQPVVFTTDGASVHSVVAAFSCGCRGRLAAPTASAGLASGGSAGSGAGRAASSRSRAARGHRQAPRSPEPMVGSYVRPARADPTLLNDAASDRPELGRPRHRLCPFPRRRMCRFRRGITCPS
jgi:DNA-binding NtrC family response regulator